jgi:hypothetical protein
LKGTLLLIPWPTIYVLDHRGVIRYKDITGDPLDAAVAALLKELE